MMSLPEFSIVSSSPLELIHSSASNGFFEREVASENPAWLIRRCCWIVCFLRGILLLSSAGIAHMHKLPKVVLVAANGPLCTAIGSKSKKFSWSGCFLLKVLAPSSPSLGNGIGLFKMLPLHSRLLISLLGFLRNLFGVLRSVLLLLSFLALHS